MGVKDMAFDYKKEYKEFYMPKGTPSIVTVPKMNYIAVREAAIQMMQTENTSRLSDFCMELHLRLK